MAEGLIGKGWKIELIEKLNEEKENKERKTGFSRDDK